MLKIALRACLALFVVGLAGCASKPQERGGSAYHSSSSEHGHAVAFHEGYEVSKIVAYKGEDRFTYNCPTKLGGPLYVEVASKGFRYVAMYPADSRVPEQLYGGGTSFSVKDKKYEFPVSWEPACRPKSNN